MKTTMFVDAMAIPIGEITLHFQYFGDDNPPYAWLDLHSDSEKMSLGGIAINCFDVGDIPKLSGIFGHAFSAGQADEADGAELTESVFWKPGNSTLEVSSLQLKFGQPIGEFLRVEVAAVCSDHEGNSGIQVLVSGAVRIPATKPGA
jgi:hypothetical protein